MIGIDFEFFNTNSEYVELVCCTTHNTVTGEVKDWWLLDGPDTQADLAIFLEENFDTIILAYSAVAECRSFLSLGINPTLAKWIDLFLEYRCLSNHSDELNYGDQLVNGRVKKTKKPPPKWERTEEDSKNSFKPTHSLTEATFKLTGIVRDQEEKDKMRDIIISGNRELILKHKNEIMAYCQEDTVHLSVIYDAVLEQYSKRGVALDALLMEEMLRRGHYAAITAKMESLGYPIDYEKTKNFSSAVGPLLEQTQRDINDQFPDMMPFKYNRKEKRYSWDQGVTKMWLKDNVDIKSWTRTDGYKDRKKEIRNLPTRAERDAAEAELQHNIHKYLSLSLEAFEKFFPYKHSYPRGNFGAQMVGYLKLKQSMNGFLPSPNKKNFWDSVGPDRRVRPYMNSFGSQSSRSQPGATGFLFLKPAYMRVLCSPARGKAIASFDYRSEEFLISALLSNCKNMKEAYLAGDVYLYFGKLCGAIPWDGTKEQYKAERNQFKALTLGVSYLMMAKGLAGHLTAETGRKYTEEEAQELIDTFYETYDELGEWQADMVDLYEEKKMVKLPDGWYMWGDNDNFRSSINVWSQGYGAIVMRKAVELAEARGLKVIFTLHDAIYIEYASFDLGAVDTLRECMLEAFIFYFDDKKTAAQMGLDGYTWSPDYPELKMLQNDKGDWYLDGESLTTPAGLEIDCGHLYLDDRALPEYVKYSPFMEPREENEL